MIHTLFAAPLFGARHATPSTLEASFQRFCRWLVDGTPIGLKPMQQTSLRRSQPAPAQGLQAPQLTVRQSQAHQGAVRLRVVRVHESGQPRASVGRMVISGRMADVCAELDRLVAQEAALH